MRRLSLLAVLMTLGLALLHGVAYAQGGPPSAPQQALACPESLAVDDPLLRRVEILQFLQTLPEPCLKAHVKACSHASAHVMMDFGSAAGCSLGYEALLKKAFGGDFHQLMAWWRSEQAPGALQRPR